MPNHSMSSVMMLSANSETWTVPKKDTATCEKNGWNPISMHDEFKTIYGDEVKRETK